MLKELNFKWLSLDPKKRNLNGHSPKIHIRRHSGQVRLSGRPAWGKPRRRLQCCKDPIKMCIAVYRFCRPRAPRASIQPGMGGGNMWLIT